MATGGSHGHAPACFCPHYSIEPHACRTTHLRGIYSLASLVVHCLLPWPDVLLEPHPRLEQTLMRGAKIEFDDD
jgi:hypothetical protein